MKLENFAKEENAAFSRTVSPAANPSVCLSEGMKADARTAGISEDEALKRAVQKMPMGRLAEAEEIANVVVFAASDRGAFLTGANITMDGASSPTVV